MSIIASGDWTCSSAYLLPLATRHFVAVNGGTHSTGIQECINPFYIELDGKKGFSLRIFRYTNDLQEQIKFDN